MKKTRSALKSSLTPRLSLIYILVLLWAVALTGKFVQLQIIKGEKYRDRAIGLQEGWDHIRAQRGEIVDRRLVQLAGDVNVLELNADPAKIEDPEAVAKALSPILKVSPEDLIALLTRDSNYSCLKKEIAPVEAESVRQLDIKGLFFEKSNSRFYPKKTLASQILGFVGNDGKGLSGLELFYDKEVRGKQTKVHFTFDGQRKSYRRAIPDESFQGNVLILNLDQKIQYDAELALRHQVETYQAKSGSLVVMDPHTGEILAMASYPTFDPNHFQESPPETHRNRAVLDTFEPGSIFKILTLSAVLNEGAATLDEVVDCRVGTLRLAGKVYREAKRSYGDLTLRDVLAKSSNVGTIKLGLRLGPETLYGYIKRFGFGDPTNVDFPGEEDGRIRPVSQWSRISIGALCIGQEIAVTALQMIRAVSSVANGGHLVQPHLVRQILSPTGELVWKPEIKKERVLKSETARLMTEAMAAVVDHGTGSNARLAGYSSAGKTGTAQKFHNGTFNSGKYVASYVGFAPVENPALAALVVIDEPEGKYYGGTVAAPVFKEVMEKALVHLRTPRDRPVEPEPAPWQFTGTEPRPGAGVFEDGEPVSPGFIAEAVETLMEATDQPRETEYVIVLPGGLVTVPDFTGLSLRQVAAECASKGLELRFQGAGIAVAQRPQPGDSVTEGAVCEVFFSNKGQPKGRINSATGKVAFRNPIRINHQARQ